MRTSTQRDYTELATTALHGATQGRLSVPILPTADVRELSNGYMCRRPAELSSARAAITVSALSNSRRSAPVVSTADVREVDRFHTDVFIVVQPDLPAIVASKFPTANDTLPAVEVRVAAESRQANIEFKVQTIKDHVSDFVIKGAGWTRYRALQRGVAMHR